MRHLVSQVAWLHVRHGGVSPSGHGPEVLCFRWRGYLWYLREPSSIHEVACWCPRLVSSIAGPSTATPRAALPPVHGCGSKPSIFSVMDVCVEALPGTRRASWRTQWRTLWGLLTGSGEVPRASTSQPGACRDLADSDILIETLRFVSRALNDHNKVLSGFRKWSSVSCNRCLTIEQLVS